MSDGPGVPRRPHQSIQHPSQEQDNTSHTRLRPTLFQPLQIGASSVEPGQSVEPIATQLGNSVVPTSTSLPPSDPQNDVKPAQPLDQIRASVFPDLRYPGVTPDIESPVSWESHIPLPQPTPMDQGASRSQLPDPRSAPVASDTGVAASVVDGATDSPAHSLPSSSSQMNGATTSIEPEQVRRPVEHLFRLASVREESMVKRREIFDHRSGELSTFSAEAVRAVQDLQDKIESFKQLGEETRVQAEQTLQEASKMRDLADRLISSAGTLGEDMLGAKNHVGRAVERSDQMTRFVRKSFDWLATLRAREQEKIALVQAEIAEQELAEVARRQEELQRQLERRKIEEQQKKEAAQREEAEREALRKKKEEESEAARKRAYEMRRAEVMAEKWRATQAHAQSIQAERERRVTDASGFSSTPSAHGTHPSFNASIPPTSNSEPTHGAGISTFVTSSQIAVPVPSRSPVARTGEVPDVVPPSHIFSPLSKNVKAVPALVSFVPAQTEAGRTVNTDLPLSSTTLASELHIRNNVEAPQHPHFNQATRDPAQEQPQMQPRHALPTVVSHPVEVKREPSAEALPATRVQPSPDAANTDQSHNRQRVVSFSTASHDENMDQQLPILGSRATSLHVPQTDRDLRDDPPRAVSPTDSDIRPRHFILDRAPTADSRAYERQGSILSNRSISRWNDRRSSSPPSLGERRSRSLSRSPPYLRKRMRSRTPYEARLVDTWRPERPHVRTRLEDSRDRSRRYNGYERGRRGDSRYRHPPSRHYYRRSPSPPPSPRHFRNERSPPRRGYRDRTPAAEWRSDEYRPSTNGWHYGGVDAHRSTEMEEQPRWQQHERQRRSLSPSEHDQTPTSSPRREEVEIGLLDRINMEEADNGGRGRGRPPSDTMRGGPNPRRGMRGASSSGRGRGGGSGPKPALISRMTETAARLAHAQSLSDRMQQD